MTKGQKAKIEQFIKENKLEFINGRRNSDSVVISGYALSIGINNVYQLEKIIDETLPAADYEYNEELYRVFAFASANNYDKWWSTQEAKNSWKF